MRLQVIILKLFINNKYNYISLYQNLMYISILKCGPGLLFIGLSWPSVQFELEMPALRERGLCATPFIILCIMVDRTSFF
jgi:hypothetical protein